MNKKFLNKLLKATLNRVHNDLIFWVFLLLLIMLIFQQLLPRYLRLFKNVTYNDIRFLLGA
jgi:hypothetical protein